MLSGRFFLSLPIFSFGTYLLLGVGGGDGDKPRVIYWRVASAESLIACGFFKCMDVVGNGIAALYRLCCFSMMGDSFLESF